MKPRSPVFDPRITAAIGVFAAGLLLTEVNVLSARKYARFDVTEDQRFSLHRPTTQLLDNLDTPVSITVLLSNADPNYPEARNLLASYRAQTKQLSIDYIDPDRDTAKFLALSQKLNLGDEQLSQDGITTAAFLIESAENSWFVRHDKLSHTDAEGVPHSRMESELSEGIARVTQRESARICFTTGHGERSIDDAAPEGLLRFQRRLAQSNIETERVPFDVPDLAGLLSGCDAIAVVGPSRPFPRSHEKLLIEAYQAGVPTLLFLDPLLSPDGTATSSGLQNLAHALGVILAPGFVLESDPAYRLPEGLGESFFATVKAHPVTEGLSKDSERTDARVLVMASQALRPVPAGSAVPLLTTSPTARFADDLNTLEGDDKNNAHFTLAMANDHQTRSIVAGSSNLLFNDSFQNPSLYGNQVFAENAFAWTLDRKPLINIKHERKMGAGLNLSEASLTSLLLYVLVYLPLTAACLGAFLLLRRRRLEERSRRAPAEVS